MKYMVKLNSLIQQKELESKQKYMDYQRENMDFIFMNLETLVANVKLQEDIIILTEKNTEIEDVILDMLEICLILYLKEKINLLN